MVSGSGCVAVSGICYTLIAGLAEHPPSAHRYARGESELVAGFTRVFGDEIRDFFEGNTGITLISSMVVLFLGGWQGPFLPPLVWFIGKTFLFICGFILLRAALPRLRFDQLMALGWKVLLPLTLLNLLVTGAIALLRTRKEGRPC
jgi:NADH-quinone oxidoreductase subunit H